MTARLATVPARIVGALADPEHLAGLVLTLSALVVYWLTGPTGRWGDSFIPLADAFLHGRVSIFPDLPWFELVPVQGGNGAQYSPFPPVPAVTLMPLVALVGAFGGQSSGIPANVMSAIVGAANVWMAWTLLGRIGVSFRPRQVLTIGFAFTTHWWVAGMAGTHVYAQVVATFFLLIALLLGVSRRWPVVAGLALGLAAGSRLPTGLALPLLVVLYADGWRVTRGQLLLLAGLALPAGLIGWYNLARFGSPADFGYARIPSGEFGLVTDEPWFRHGLLSPLYIPRHLYAIFLQSFDFANAFPYLKPTINGLALTLSAPFLFFAVRARGALVPATWLAVALVMAPDLMHGSWGFAQFGYRFILDAVPLLLLLLGWAYRDRASGWLIAAVAVGVVMHAYGIFVWNVLDFVGT